MKTILDRFDELILESLHSNGTLICYLAPMVKGERNLKMPHDKIRYKVEFRGAGDFIVLQEVVNVALGLVSNNDGHLTEITSQELVILFQFSEIFPQLQIKHYVLNTSHCSIHVFTEVEPVVSEVTVS